MFKLPVLISKVFIGLHKVKVQMIYIEHLYNLMSIEIEIGC